MIGLTDYALLSIFLVSLIVVLTASEIGRWIGRAPASSRSANSQ